MHRRVETHWCRLISQVVLSDTGSAIRIVSMAFAKVSCRKAALVKFVSYYRIPAAASQATGRFFA